MVTNKHKTVSVDVEFIKEAYNEACSEWKQKLEEKFPTLFPNIFKPGNLVTNKNTGIVLLVTNPNGEEEENFSGVVINSGTEGYEVGHAADDWVREKVTQYNKKFNLAAILNIK